MYRWPQKASHRTIITAQTTHKCRKCSCACWTKVPRTDKWPSHVCLCFTNTSPETRMLLKYLYQLKKTTLKDSLMFSTVLSTYPRPLHSTLREVCFSSTESRGYGRVKVWLRFRSFLCSRCPSIFHVKMWLICVALLHFQACYKCCSIFPDLQ